MSRIHEALKKAAQERSVQPASLNEASLLELTAPSQPAPPVREAEDPATPLVVTTESIGFLRFEDLAKKCAKPKWNIDARMSVFEGNDSNQVGAERFRTLRSRLYQISGTRPLRRIAITSSVPAEGKTFVTANLAQSFVRQPDRRVLLIDGDLRASRLHEVLGAPRTPGLSEYLQGQADEYQVVQMGSDANLCLIPGGREVTNPSELLMNERLRKLLELMTPLFDWIIIDTPPTLPVHDASMIADMCDGVLFVVRAGSTDHEVAAKATAEFQDRNLVGVVLNRADHGASYGGYYYGLYPEHEKS
jgi:capsular exopolysaccharide synthesis family protein